MSESPAPAPLPPDCLKSFSGHPLLDHVEHAFGFSRFLGRVVNSDVDACRAILEHPSSRGLAAGSFRGSVVERIASLSPGDDIGRELRMLRRRLMAMIAWADLGGVFDLEATIAAVSELADALISAAVDHLYEELSAKHGTPRDRGGNAVPMVVLGLGKLGGRELNFSSDVDLIFCFAEAGETDGERPLSNEEFFIRLGRRLVKLLDEPTADGFVFRTDMRLRPNGASGPLALSFDAMEHYYQAHGRDWERYALIKARAVAGDRNRGAELLAALRPFVYRKYLDFSAFESIREMKTLIDRELQRKGRRGDIKLGRGGIREIEFICQSHQLIRGGREPGLQTSSLHAAFGELERLGVIDGDDAAALLDAYRFLRNTEHRLQMVDDLQTQQLPGDAGAQQALAQSMGFDDWDSFSARLDRHRELVHGHFSQLFGTEGAARGGDADGFADAWLETRSDEASAGFFGEHGFADPDQAIRLVRAIRHGRVYQSFSRNGRERLDRMMPAALREIAATHDPDRTLSRLAAIVEGIGRRSAYFALLAENPLALKQLVQLIGASAWIANWIGQHPVILDELLDPIANAALLPPETVRSELSRRLQRAEGDMEAQMDLLREYKNGYFLRVAALSAAGVIDPGGVRHALSDLAEGIIGAIIPVAEGSLTAKVREQVADIVGDLAFGVVAYGKLGGREVSYGSDLDLVFLFRADPPVDASRDPTLGYYFSRLAQRFIHVLNTTTRAGVLYETDIRLRPSGRSGTMVSSLNAFRDYQAGQAWTWEHQALVRARMIAGPAALIDAFEAVRREILAVSRDRETLRGEVADMRRRMSEANSKSSATSFDLKLGDGGIVDIEFITQYLVLGHAAEQPEILAPRGTRELLHSLADAGLLDQATAAGLADAYSAYLDRELVLKLQEREAVVDDGEYRDERATVTRAWRELFGAADSLDPL